MRVRFQCDDGTCIDSEAVRIIGQWPISMSYEITENPERLTAFRLTLIMLSRSSNTFASKWEGCQFTAYKGNVKSVSLTG